MINKIDILNVATFKSQSIIPSEVNYFYGNNGSGKTTISKIIKTPEKYDNCVIEWENNNKLETLVYNKDFVKENFKNCDSIKGIFTLGKDTKEAKEIIEKLKIEIDENYKKIVTFKKSLEGLENKIAEDKNNIVEICWGQKKALGETYNSALYGNLKKESFFENCIKELNNDSKLLDLESLKNKYNIVYNSKIKKYDIINNVRYAEINILEKHNILSKVVTGKDNVEIGKLIKKLNNSDWVKQGVKFYEETDNKCPFCQQDVSQQLFKSITDFFDETYEREYNEINALYNNYKILMGKNVEYLKSILVSDIDIIDKDILEKQITKLENIYVKNISMIEEKLKSPNKIIQLDDTSDIFKDSNDIIVLYNEKINENNRVVDNISNEQENFKKLLWRYILNNIKDNIVEYMDENTKKLAGIKTIKEKIDEYKEKNIKLDNDMKIKEAEVTSVVHTVNEINGTLKKFGFIGFKLNEAGEPGTYKITRMDGSDVKETLSEGEYNFISFLYFYQLIKGSIESSGTVRDKIVVIDDPISSLDSNVLFIVSTLVKSIINDCFSKVNGIKQVFVLTHNVYFHKEITYKSRGEKKKEESFWVVQKNDEISSIISHENNPIQTTYELLWRELDDLSKPSKPTIFNTLRRILEYYFNILGGDNYERYEDMFEGEEKIIFKSLISCVNDSSHFINDDFSVCLGQDSVDKYIQVFQRIFDVTGHINHYNMMMRIKSE